MLIFDFDPLMRTIITYFNPKTSLPLIVAMSIFFPETVDRMRCRFPEFYVLSIFAGRHNGKWFSLQSGIQLSSFSISGWDLILSRGVVGFLVTGSLGVSDRIFYWRRSTFRLH